MLKVLKALYRIEAETCNDIRLSLITDSNFHKKIDLSSLKLKILMYFTQIFCSFFLASFTFTRFWYQNRDRVLYSCSKFHGKLKKETVCLNIYHNLAYQKVTKIIINSTLSVAWRKTRVYFKYQIKLNAMQYETRQVPSLIPMFMLIGVI